MTIWSSVTVGVQSKMGKPQRVKGSAQEEESERGMGRETDSGDERADSLGSGQGFRGPDAEITKAIPMREKISSYKTREQAKHVRVTGAETKESHI